MLTKLISPFLFLAFLSGCASISPQDIPAEIQKNNNVGELILSTPVQAFYFNNPSNPDGTPVDRYLTVFSNAIVISAYEGRYGRNLVSKIFTYKTIDKVSFASGDITEYYRPKFLTINWSSDKQVNQFAFSSGGSYFAIRLSNEDFEKVRDAFKDKKIAEFDVPLAKRVRTPYDADMEASGIPYYLIMPVK